MKRKKILSIVLTTVMMFSLVSCSNSGGEATNNAGENNSEKVVVTTEPFIDDEGFTQNITLDSDGSINVFAFNEGQNYKKVIDKFESVTKDTLKTKINFQFASNIKEEAPLKLAAKEDIDLIFDAGWVNMDNNIKANMYTDLTSYFNNPDYPGLQKAFPAEVLDSLKYTDGKIYGIPYYGNYNSLLCMYIRGDWREKYGLPEVTDDETFKLYLDTIQEHAEELNIVSSMGLGDRGYFYFLEEQPSLANEGIFEVSGTGARVTQNMFVLMNEDRTEVVDAGMIGDLGHDYSAWPDGKNPFNEIALELGSEWGQYANSDAITATTSAKDKFVNGLYGAIESDIWSYTDIATRLAEYDPNAKLEYYFYEEVVRNKEENYMGPNISNNYMFVPYYCDDVDRVMAVVDWVFASQENFDLWCYGIEGDDWEAASDKTYKVIADNDDQYSFPTYVWASSPLYQRIDANYPEDLVEYFEYAEDVNNFREHPFSGFSFDNTNISLEYTALNTLQEDYYHQFMLGSFGEDTEAKIKEFSDAAQGYQDTLREEVIKQVNEFIKNK